MKEAQTIAKGIARQVSQNVFDQWSAVHEVFQRARQAGSKLADEGLTTSPTQLWAQAKAYPQKIKKAGQDQLQHTVELYNSVKEVGQAVSRLGDNALKVADSLTGVGRFADSVAKDVEDFQKKSQPALDRINHLLNK